MCSLSKFTIVTIDGAAATGKSSTSRGLAKRFKLMHVDTGAHYRTLTNVLLQADLRPSQTTRIKEYLVTLRLDTQLEANSAQLIVNGVVPNNADIRSQEVNDAVSKFASLPTLRDYLFDYQRSQEYIARVHGFEGLIMEGRDIGSVIFPNTKYRFFIHADQATRRARRSKEGQNDTIALRDKIDKSRVTAPLVCPDGATRIDTTTLTLNEVIEKIAKLISSSYLL